MRQQRTACNTKRCVLYTRLLGINSIPVACRIPVSCDVAGTNCPIGVLMILAVISMWLAWANDGRAVVIFDVRKIAQTISSNQRQLYLHVAVGMRCFGRHPLQSVISFQRQAVSVRKDSKLHQKSPNSGLIRPPGVFGDSPSPRFGVHVDRTFCPDKGGCTTSYISSSQGQHEI